MSFTIYEPDEREDLDPGTTYQEIADYLFKTDPSGVSDLIFMLFEKDLKLIVEVLSWPIVTKRMAYRRQNQ